MLEFLGILFTAIIQSSSAMTGIIIVMISNQAMSVQNALFITLGANIGTCVTALIAVIGGNINSKRAAVIHLTFNFFGCTLFTPILWIFTDKIIYILESIVSKEPMQIAIFHLFFNCVTAIITTPLIKFFVKFSEFVIRDKKNNILEKLIDNVDDMSEIIRSEESINKNKMNEDIDFFLKEKKKENDININNKVKNEDNILMKDNINENSEK